MGKEEFEAGDEVGRVLGICCCRCGSGRCIEGIWFVRAVRDEVMINLPSNECGSIGFSVGGDGSAFRTSW